MNVKWDSETYLKFERERTKPAIDLINSIDKCKPRRILDIGCGPGNSTNILYKAYSDASIVGIDSSLDMINSAKDKYHNIKWLICNAENELNTLGKEYDIVFSNACIQWIPNHNKLIKEMFNLLNDNGVLAVQIPNNHNGPIHRIIQNVIKSEKWESFFSNERKLYILKDYEYFDILSELTNDFKIWETTYYHELDSYESILQWYRGTGLRPYLCQISSEKQKEFEKDILEQVKKIYTIQKNGHIIFKFPRLFFTAKKEG